MDAFAGRVVLPAVIRANQLAALHLAERELELTVRATVLDRRELAVLAAEQRDRLLPERDLFDLAAFDVSIPFDRVPIIRVHSGGARLLTAVLRLLERRRSIGTKRDQVELFHASALFLVSSVAGALR